MKQNRRAGVISLLQDRGAEVVFHDPYVAKVRLEDEEIMQRTELTDELLETADCIVIVTDHSAYDWQHILDHSALVIDTRHVTLPRTGRARVITL